MTCLQNGPYAVAYRFATGSIIVLCASLMAGVASARMERIDTAITLGSEWAYGIESHQDQKLEIIIKPELEAKFGPDTRLTVIARLRQEASGRLAGDNVTDTELREFYVETNLGRSLITLGKQQIVWGKADGLKVLDVINPQDWREFILDDLDDSRIPLWSVNAEIPIRDITLQLVWLPDQTYHRFAKGNDLYRFTSPRFIPQAPAGVSVMMEPMVKPGRRLQDADWAMRLSTFWQGWDLTLNYLYHYDDGPVLFRQFDMTASGPLVTITPRYERSHLLGSTFSSAFGDLTLRGEVGYSLDRYISTNDTADSDGVIKTNELAYVVGLDWFGLGDTLLSTQFFQSRLSHHTPGMIRDKTETTLTLLVKQEFLNDTVSTEILWIHSLDIDDGLARPKISYQMNDETSLWLGVDLFYGDKIGLFGQFNHRDRFIAGIEFSY